MTCEEFKAVSKDLDPVVFEDPTWERHLNECAPCASWYEAEEAQAELWFLRFLHGADILQ